MTHMKYLPTKDLFQALIEAKRAFGRGSGSVEATAPPVRSTPEDVAPVPEALLYERE